MIFGWISSSKSAIFGFGSFTSSVFRRLIGPKRQGNLNEKYFFLLPEVTYVTLLMFLTFF